MQRFHLDKVTYKILKKERTNIDRAMLVIGVAGPLATIPQIIVIFTRKQVEGISFYSTSYDFSLESEKSTAFREQYKQKFDKEPNFGAAFGYDILNLVDSCKAQGVGDKRDIRDCIHKVPVNQGIAGTAEQVRPGDFVATMHLEKVN
jgi:hypothetical protein